MKIPLVKIKLYKLYKCIICTILTKDRIEANLLPYTLDQSQDLILKNIEKIKTSIVRFNNFIQNIHIKNKKQYYIDWIRGFLVYDVYDVYHEFDRAYIFDIICKNKRIYFLAHIKIKNTRYFNFISHRLTITNLERNIENNETFDLFMIINELGILVPDITPREVLITIIKSDLEFCGIIGH